MTQRKVFSSPPRKRVMEIIDGDNGQKVELLTCGHEYEAPLDELGLSSSRPCGECWKYVRRA